MTLSSKQRTTLLDLITSVYNTGYMGDWSEVYEFISNHSLKDSLKLSVGDGASKIAIVISSYRAVLKWSHAPDRDEAIKEVEIYNRAVSKELGQFFPHTELFCTLGTYKVVLQEMVDASCNDLSHAQKRRLDKKCNNVNRAILEKVQYQVKYACSDYRRDLNRVWASRALTIYGKRKVKALCKFIEDEQINDLHENNIGYLNGKPILLDFCGYWGA